MSNKELIAKLREDADEMEGCGAGNEADTMRLAADALEAMEWQPIETAPKEGVILAGLRLHIPIVAAWSPVFGQWEGPIYGHGLDPQPTHWKPLPKSPEE